MTIKNYKAIEKYIDIHTTPVTKKAAHEVIENISNEYISYLIKQDREFCISEARNSYKNGFINYNDFREEINRIEYITSLRVLLADYLFLTKNNPQKLVEHVKTAAENIDTINESSLLIFDPIMRSMIMNSLKNEELEQYKKIVEEFDEKLNEYKRQQKEIEIQKRIKESQERLNINFDHKISSTNFELRKARYSQPKFIENKLKQELETWKKLKEVVNKFYNSINQVEFVNKIFNQETINNYNEMLEISKLLGFDGLKEINKITKFLIETFGKYISEQFRKEAEKQPKEIKQEKSEQQQQQQPKKTNEQELLSNFKEERAKQKQADSEERKYILFEVITNENGEKTVVPVDLNEVNIERKTK